jgi:hypothetical protein
MDFQPENLQQLWSIVGAYALTGAVITALVQTTKNWISTKKGKQFWAFLISIVVGAAVYFAQLLPGSWLMIMAGVWGAANTVFLLFLDSPKK